MKYEKPELMLQADAVTAIQDPTDKSEIDTVDSLPHQCSFNAYAADE